VTQGRAHGRLLLALASVAVAFAAADTYVVVLALEEMMRTAQLTVSELQRAAPIISGFLLGYVAMLPLIGRIADLRGRVPVLMMSLVVFSLGSLVTAFSYDLASMVVGRFLQGVGGGGLVPATLALVADLYVAERRGVPLGIVSAVQEAGALAGPLFGALVLAFAPWQAIFVVNLVVGVALALLVAVVTRRDEPRGAARRWSLPDPVGVLALVVAFAAYAVLSLRPSSIQRDLTWGQVFVPYAGDGVWLTPIGVTTIAASVVFLLRCWFARRPLVDLRSWTRVLVEADLVGALLVAAALGGVILAFATADPAVDVLSPQGPWFLLGSAVATAFLVVHLRRATDPLVPRGALAARPAWGALLVSLLVGAALIAAVVTVPTFARTTVYPDHLDASLVLVRFLVALPVGAVVGGYLTRRYAAGLVTAVGMLAASGAFVLMARWDDTSLLHPHSTLTLLLCGLGFGLALAPVNAALLASTRDEVHGIAAAFVVVARMIGMLVGISALTTIGLRRFHAAREGGAGILEAAIAQEHAIFLGAGGCALLAALVAVPLFRGAPTRGLTPAEMLRAGG
jgi:MFS family permease